MASIEKRTTPDGITYRVKVRLKGYPLQTASFKRLTDAKRWAQHTETAIREGRHFKTAEAKRHTLSEAIDRYMKYVMPNKPKSAYTQTIHLSWWKQAAGNYSLADITPALIASCRDRLGEEETKKGKPRAPATVNRYLAALSHLFTIAYKEWEWVDDNPFRKVTKKIEPRGRVRFLADDERTRLIKACEESRSHYLQLIVVLALSTGARRMEILSLKWSDIDLQKNIITAHETKNGERRTLPLAGLALKLMKEHTNKNQNQSDYIFPNQRKNGPIDIRKPFETALNKAEITDFRFHDLRHSAASYLAMNGASLAEIAEVLGHKTLQMVKRYAHLSKAHTASVVASMNERIFK